MVLTISLPPTAKARRVKDDNVNLIQITHISVGQVKQFLGEIQARIAYLQIEDEDTWTDEG